MIYAKSSPSYEFAQAFCWQLAARESLTSASDAQSIFTNGFPAGLPAPVVIGAVGNINLLGNGTITDSYNSHDTNFSTNGQYDPSKASTNGSVASVQGLVNIANHTITGNLYLGPTATYVGSGTVSGAIYNNSSVQFPDVALPSGASSWPTASTTSITTTNSKGKVTTITSYDFKASGNYILTTDAYPIYVEAGVAVNLNVTSLTFAPTDLEIHGGITNSGTAYIYLNGPTSASIAGNSAVDASGRPENLWYFGLPTVTSFTLSGALPFAGVIYAPEANLILNGGGNTFAIIGSVIVYTVTMQGHYEFHYDESLTAGHVFINSQPSSQVVPLGTNVTFTVSATGNAPLWYVWYQWVFTNRYLIVHASGTNYSSLTLNNVQPSDAGDYIVIVSNAFNSVASSPATLTVIVSPPVITAQPTNQIVLAGSPAVFGVTASGSNPLSYQWQLNGTNLPNGIITTVAGNGTTNYSGDGGAATNAGLYRPSGVALDSSGNLFIADTDNNRIRKISTGGIITTVAGSGPTGFGTGSYSGDGGAATNATLNGPTSVAVDANGNLFIADYLHDRIREVSANGIITTIAGGGTSYPDDGGAATNADLGDPIALTLDANGNLFFAENDGFRVRKVTTNGILTTVAGINEPGGFSGDGGPATNANLSLPASVAADDSGNLFIADAGNDRIRKVSTNGIITTVVGSTPAPFYGGGSYSGDGGAATNATLNLPEGVALDASSNLFIADTYNQRIREVNASSVITTIAGNGTTNYFGDGGAAANASLNYPTGFEALDPGGNILIAVWGNNWVRKVSNTQGPVLMLNPVGPADAGNYQLVVTNLAGMVVSSNVVLTVVFSPNNQTNLAGTTAAFTVQTFGPESLNYQWQKDGDNLIDGGNISGSTSNQLTIANVSDADVAGYSVVVSDATTSALQLPTRH